ncbi:MAG: cation:proton antiporter [Velocimicrobium sp.]
MLTSLALIFLLGLLLGSIFNRLKLPSLLGMILTGMILSPYAFNLLDPSIITISADLRELALVIILTRAGLSLNLKDLKKVGRPAVLMCFVPACFEIIGVVLVAPSLFGLSLVESLIMGSVIAAVSPAVIVPRMIHIIEEGYGIEHGVPQLILAGSSVDDVFVIVLFTAFTSLEKGGKMSPIHILQIPFSILLGIVVGIAIGLCLTFFFQKFHMRDSVKILIILSVSFLLLALQKRIENIVPFSALLAIMSIGISIYEKHTQLAERLSAKYNRLWVAAEVLLFVLVGAKVDLTHIKAQGLIAVLVVLAGLVFRMFGVFVCMIKSRLNKKERIFCMVAYTPKATVQAAIGALPLSMGLACGQSVLTVAVMSILITAPFGAICVDKLYKKLLTSS